MIATNLNMMEPSPGRRSDKEQRALLEYSHVVVLVLAADVLKKLDAPGSIVGLL